MLEMGNEIQAYDRRAKMLGTTDLLERFGEFNEQKVKVSGCNFITGVTDHTRHRIQKKLWHDNQV